MRLMISSKRVFIFLLTITLILVSVHIMGQLSRFLLGYDYLKGMIPLFNLEMETNVPTAWSSFLLLTAALVSLLIAKLKIDPASNRKYWIGLVVIFVYLSLDEFMSLHERSMEVTRETFDTSGLLYYAWVIPMGIFVLTVALLYSRFVFSMDKKTRLLFILSGGIFVIGAIGLELFEGAINEQGGYLNLTYMVLVTVEETLEMLGVCIFIYALLDYLQRQAGRFDVSLLDD